MWFIHYKTKKEEKVNKDFKDHPGPTFTMYVDDYMHSNQNALVEYKFAAATSHRTLYNVWITKGQIQREYAGQVEYLENKYTAMCRWCWKSKQGYKSHPVNSFNSMTAAVKDLVRCFLDTRRNNLEQTKEKL